MCQYIIRVTLMTLATTFHVKFNGHFFFLQENETFIQEQKSTSGGKLSFHVTVFELLKALLSRE